MTTILTEVANPQTIVAPRKATMVKNLLKQYNALGEEEKKIQESRAAVRDLLVNMFEEGSSELVVGDKRMASLSKETRTLLNTEMIRRNFPKEKFESLYTTSEVSVLRLTKEARALS